MRAMVSGGIETWRGRPSANAFVRTRFRILLFLTLGCALVTLVPERIVHGEKPPESSQAQPAWRPWDTWTPFEKLDSLLRNYEKDRNGTIEANAYAHEENERLGYQLAWEPPIPPDLSWITHDVVSRVAQALAWWGERGHPKLALDEEFVVSALHVGLDWNIGARRLLEPVTAVVRSIHDLATTQGADSPDLAQPVRQLVDLVFGDVGFEHQMAVAAPVLAEFANLPRAPVIPERLPTLFELASERVGRNRGRDVLERPESFSPREWTPKLVMGQLSFVSRYSPESREAVQAFIAEMERGTVPLPYVEAFARNYEELVAELPDQINLIKNSAPLLQMYGALMTDFMAAAEAYRRAYDMPGRNPSRLEDVSYDRREAKKKLERFFLLNPQVDLLKGAAALWGKVLSPGAPESRRKGKGVLRPGTRVPLLSESEVNAVRWFAKNFPKGEPTRDLRRRLHQVILELAERRIQREGDPVAAVMSGALLGLNRDLATPQDRHAAALAFADFGLAFDALPLKMQKNFSKGLQAKLDELVSRTAVTPTSGASKNQAQQGTPARATHRGLAAAEYKALAEYIGQRTRDVLLKNTISLSDADLEVIRRHIEAHPEVWSQGNLLTEIARYHGFQSDDGKRTVESLLTLLGRAPVRRGRFMVDRSAMDSRLPEIAEITAHVDPTLLHRLETGFRAPYSAGRAEATDVHALTHRIWQDMVLHLGIPEPQQNERLTARAAARFVALGGSAKGAERFGGLLDELRDKLAFPEPGETLNGARVKYWTQTLAELGRELPAGSLPWQEFTNNVEEVRRLATAKESPQRRSRYRGVFRVDGNPRAFIRSGVEPTQTCQRTIERTSYNEDGEPIRRALYPQFGVARVERANGGPFDIRSVVELAPDGLTGEVGLLVEQPYVRPGQPIKPFNRRVLDWASNHAPEATFCAFAVEPPVKQQREIQPKLLPTNGPVYRDTFRHNGSYMAVDLRAYRDAKRAKAGTGR